MMISDKDINNFEKLMIITMLFLFVNVITAYTFIAYDGAKTSYMGSCVYIPEILESYGDEISLKVLQDELLEKTGKKLLGLYDPSNDKIYNLLDEKDPNFWGVEVHELCHAIQDIKGRSFSCQEGYLINVMQEFECYYKTSWMNLLMI